MTQSTIWTKCLQLEAPGLKQHGSDIFHNYIDYVYPDYIYLATTSYDH